MTPIRRLAVAVPLTLGVLGAGLACETDRTTVFEPVGPAAFDFGLSTNSSAALPSGTVAVGGTSVTLTAVSLRALSSGAYQFWVVHKDAQNNDVPTAAFGPVLEFFLRDSTDGGVVVTDPVSGDPIRVTDTNEVSLARTSTYTGTDDPDVFAVEVVIDSTADGTNPAGSSNIAIVVSLEATAGASAPGPARFLWRNTGAAGSGPLTFGTFSGVDGVNEIAPSDYVYEVAGGGTGGVRGDEIAVLLEEITRPPVGFFYRGYLVDAAGGTGLMIDTLHSQWSADSTLSRVSLFDVDDNSLLPGLSGTNITDAVVRNCVAGSGVLGCDNSLTVSPADADKPFGEFLTFALVLDPKGAADGLGGAVVITGEVPDEAR